MNSGGTRRYVCFYLAWSLVGMAVFDLVVMAIVGAQTNCPGSVRHTGTTFEPCTDLQSHSVHLSEGDALLTVFF